MSNTLKRRNVSPPLQTQPFACCLRRKEVMGRNGLRPYMAEIELENLSDAPLEIEYRLTALQYLNLLVYDSTETVVSQYHFADRFSPTFEPNFLRLAPGEKFTANVHLFATAPDSMKVPGTYSVQAIYEYNGFRAVSEPVEVT